MGCPACSRPALPSSDLMRACTSGNAATLNLCVCVVCWGLVLHRLVSSSDLMRACISKKGRHVEAACGVCRVLGLVHGALMQQCVRLPIQALQMLWWMAASGCLAKELCVGFWNSYELCCKAPVIGPAFLSPSTIAHSYNTGRARNRHSRVHTHTSHTSCTHRHQAMVWLDVSKPARMKAPISGSSSSLVSGLPGCCY